MATKATTYSAASGWRTMFMIAGWAAILASLIFLGDIIVLTTQGTFPASAEEFFSLLQTDKLAGILQLFFTDLVGFLLMLPIVYAIYGAMKGSNTALAGFAAVLAFTGLAILISTNMNYAMLYFSERHAATTEVERSQIITVGESLIATNLNGTAPIVGSFLIEGALTLFSFLMLRASPFSKWLAGLGLVAHGLDWVRTLLTLLIVPIAGAALADSVAIPLLAIGGSLQLIWYPWIGWRFLKLAQE